MDALKETTQILSKMFEQYNAVSVSYSGGKDSVVAMDLAVKTFKRVEAFFMYVIPDMECVQPAMDFAYKRWGITVRQYPHFAILEDMGNGVYCNNTDRVVLPKYSLTDIYNVARADSDTMAVVTGMKRNDSMMRRQHMKWNEMGANHVWHPLAGWTNHDVRAYCLRHKLESPLSFSGQGASSGIGLDEETFLWLADKYPRDFFRMCEIFPYAEAAIWKRRFYDGQGNPRPKNQINRRSVFEAPAA
jgi:phosphoadenosine phosphosulfate reductase